MKFTTYIEIPVTVEFDYQPSEKQTLTYPGCQEDADITAVVFNTVDLGPFLDSRALEQLRLEALDYVQGINEADEDHEYELRAGK